MTTASLDEQRAALVAQLQAQRRLIAQQLEATAVGAPGYPRSITFRLLIQGVAISRKRKRGPVSAAALAALALALSLPASSAETTVQPEMSAWIQQMKTAPRGPFAQVRWYCADGVVLEPKAGACIAHGGGLQHGEWSERTRQIRAAGYPIANLLVTTQPATIVGPEADPGFLPILLLERFLIASDDGWIMRRARSYRGVLQDYNEKEHGAILLQALLDDSAVVGERFAVVREAVRLLPHGTDTLLFTEVRGMATTLADADPDFLALRVRIHNTPDPGDAERVRSYATSALAKPDLQASYAMLAAAIDRSYLPRALPASLQRLRTSMPTPAAAQRLRDLAGALAAPADASERFTLATEVMVLMREQLAAMRVASDRLAAMDASLAAEAVAFVASRELAAGVAHASRAQRLAWIDTAARATWALGLLDARELAEIGRTLATLGVARVELRTYREALQALSRATAWPARRLDYHFGGGIEQLARIEPLATGYVADRLRSSPMLLYSGLLETLVRDADTLGGTRHDVFGAATSAGLRRLNPGIARGVLRVGADVQTTAGASPAIWLVPETSADLPPAAGIITLREGNAISHVQLLARNLGIPNVVAGQDVLDTLSGHRGETIVLAASVGGVVRIEADGPQWQALLGEARANTPRAIEINVAKLQLDRDRLIPTSQLRAADSGRSVGPKAAQVGELTHWFPDHVSPGLAVPFGVYRAILAKPSAAGGPPMLEWLKAQYDELALRKSLDPEYYARRVPEVLAFARDWFAQVEIGEPLRRELFDAMQDSFGMDGTYGVFVRSDTNVEDLPGFTGAGLNLTLANVVGFDAVIAALRRVWASPFTERAFGWRQDLMDHPEQVYASVLLHRSVYSDKSGVLITADIDSGDRGFLTVATNLGVSGAVDGQAAESLRISLASGEARLLSSATARTRLALLPAGGSQPVASAAPDAVLTPDDIAQLVAFVRALPPDYPGLKDATGAPAPADIEFGFAGGRLMLLQIRPFLQSRAAAGSDYLIQMDAALGRSATMPVVLGEVPQA